MSRFFPFFKHYPGTNLHEIDLDYVLRESDEAYQHTADLMDWADHHQQEYEDLKHVVDSLINHMVDIIIPWDSSAEYPIYSIVEYQGTNYIAVQDVPVGVMITNTDYWQPANTVIEQINAIGASVSALKWKFWYNVSDFGIEPGTGDVYQQLFEFLRDTVRPRGGGFVYFPKGTYNLSYTIFIPENTIFIGDGPETILNFTEDDTYMGVGLSNDGSNVGVMYMSVNQATQTPFAGWPSAGCIGYSNFDVSDVTEPFSHEYGRRALVENLFVDHIWSNGSYPLQTEPGDSGVVRGVSYTNVYAPNGMVSVMSGTESAAVENVIMDTITCDILNCGGSRAVNHTIRNLYAASARLYDRDGTVLDGADLNYTRHKSTLFGYPLSIDGNASIKGTTVINEGVCIKILSAGRRKWEDCRIAPTGSTGQVVDNEFAPGDNNYDELTICTIFAATVPSYMYGRAAACDLRGTIGRYMEGGIDTIIYRPPYAGYDTVGDEVPSVRAIGNTVKVYAHLRKTSGNLSSTTLLPSGTVPPGFMRSSTQILGFLYNTSNPAVRVPVNLVWSSAGGLVLVDSPITISNYNAFYINDTYPVWRYSPNQQYLLEQFENP